jgi:sugar phosphate isomerase/epimerase
MVSSDEGSAARRNPSTSSGQGSAGSLPAVVLCEGGSRLHRGCGFQPQICGKMPQPRLAPYVESCTVAPMSLVRCFSTLGCPDLSLEESLALAAKHGIDAVELRALGGTLELPAYLQARYGSPEALARQVKAQRIRIASLDTSWHLAGGTAEERDAFLAFLPWAEALDVPWLRVFDGKVPLEQPAAFAEAADSVRWWRALRRERGVRADVMVETHDSLFTADAIQRFRDAARGTAILWDSHHTWKKGGEDPVVTWRAIRDSVAHVHVKDSIPVASERHPFTYVLPGDGGFPIAALLAALRADGFKGAVSLEWEKMWHPYLPPLDTALATAAARGWW